LKRRMGGKTKRATGQGKNIRLCLSPKRERQATSPRFQGGRVEKGGKRLAKGAGRVGVPVEFVFHELPNLTMERARGEVGNRKLPKGGLVGGKKRGGGASRGHSREGQHVRSTG